MLQRDGWVDLRPRQGAFVHEPTVREVDEVFAVRRVMEVEAAQQAAVNRLQDDVEVLRGAIEEGREELSDGDSSAVVTANTTFHRVLTRIANNRVLADMVGRLDKRIRWYLRAGGRGTWPGIVG